MIVFALVFAYVTIFICKYNLGPCSSFKWPILTIFSQALAEPLTGSLHEIRLPLKYFDNDIAIFKF